MTKRVKSIIQIVADKLAPPPVGKHGKPQNDNDFLSTSIKEFPELKDSQAIDGKQMMSTAFMRGYNIVVTDNKGNQRYLIAFVYPQLNKEVLKFLVYAAKKDSINKIIGMTDHVCIVGEYKLQGGPVQGNN